MNSNREKKALSLIKVAANQNNAKRSTVPRTSKGKRASSRNSYKHGFYALRLFPNRELTGSEGIDYTRVYDYYVNYYSPSGALEKLCVEKIVVHVLRQARLLDHEKKMFDSAWPFEFPTDKLMRFEAHVTRELEKAINEPACLQEARLSASNDCEYSDGEIANVPAEAEGETDQTAVAEQPARQPSNLADTPPTEERSNAQVNSSPQFGLDVLQNALPSKNCLSSVGQSALVGATRANRGLTWTSTNAVEENSIGSSRFIETAEDAKLVEKIKSGYYDSWRFPEDDSIPD
jgi:hypothetical protein